MAESKAPKLSIVIPVYQSEEIIPKLASQLISVLAEYCKETEGFEIIFVCDNSPDRSWSAIEKLCTEHKCIKGVLLRVNAGQHNAIMAGLRISKGDFVVTMDDDLQHSPNDVASLVDRARAGADVVFAKFRTRKHPSWKIIGSWLNDLAASLLLGKPKTLYLSPFRAVRRPIVDEVIRYGGPFPYLDGLILGITDNIESVEVEHHERFLGKGGYGFRKSVSLWMKMATGFSIYPLRLTALIGLSIAFIGFFLAFALVLQKLTLDSMPDGWSSLIVAILIIGGVQLIALGVIGEYLGRTLLTLNMRPQYVVSKAMNIDNSSGEEGFAE